MEKRRIQNFEREREREREPCRFKIRKHKIVADIMRVDEDNIYTCRSRKERTKVVQTEGRGDG
jgi:hypothetical protein